MPISVVFLAPAVPLGPGLFRLLDELEATAGPVGAADDGCEILGDIGGTGSGTATATIGAAGTILGDLEATTDGAATDGCETSGVIGVTLNAVVTS